MVRWVQEDHRESARNYYRRSQTATKADLPEDRLQLLEVLVKVVNDQPTITMTTFELMKHLDQWSLQKIGKAMADMALTVEVKRKQRNQVREYIINGDAVRAAARRHGIIHALRSDQVTE